MIGHYLLTLTTEQEDRVLGQPFQPFVQQADWDATICGCLVMTATGDRRERAGASHCEMVTRPPHNGKFRAPGWAYEVLCDRFGIQRINAAIRTRILSNRARRVLSRAPVRDTSVAASR